MNIPIEDSEVLEYLLMAFLFGYLPIALVKLSAFDKLFGQGVQSLIGVVPALHFSKQGEYSSKQDNDQCKDDAQHDNVIGEEPASQCAGFLQWFGSFRDSHGCKYSMPCSLYAVGKEALRLSGALRFVWYNRGKPDCNLLKLVQKKEYKLSFPFFLASFLGWAGSYLL